MHLLSLVAGCEVSKAEKNGGLREVFTEQQSKLKQVNSDLGECVSALKDCLVTTIRKRKELEQ